MLRIGPKGCLIILFAIVVLGVVVGTGDSGV